METYIEDCKHGRFVLLKGDFISDCMARYGEWAEREVHLFNSILFEGAGVIEVGSNIGTHSVPIAKKIGSTGKFYAIEAQRVMSQVLAANIAVNNLANSRILCAVGSNQIGTILLVESNFSSWENRGAYDVPSHQNNQEGERTSVITVDALANAYAIPRVDLFKIDVEGMEEGVLRGAEQTIRKHKPYIFFECGTWENQNDHVRGDLLNSWLNSLDYQLYWYCCLGFNSKNHKKVTENKIGPFGDINILAVPANRPCPFTLRKVNSVSEIFRKDITWVEI